MLPRLAFSHAQCQTEDLPAQDESDEGGYDQSGPPAAHSAFPLTTGGSLPHQKRRKGVQMNPTSTGNNSGMTECSAVACTSSCDGTRVFAIISN